MTTVVLPEGGMIPEAPTSGSTRPGRWRRLQNRLVPYELLLPVLVALGAGLGYPLYRLVIISTQGYGLAQHFGTAPPEAVGFDNFESIFGDDYFWQVLRRSLVFCLINVALTLALGTLVALLLGKLGRGMRTLVSVALLCAWATPPLTASVVWQWIFDTRRGVANDLLTILGFDYEGHSWLSEPLSFYFVATLIVVWMGVPFIAFTLYAAMTQIPGEVLEAAAIDGAGNWERFRDITWPAIKPVFVVLAALSTLWDLRVFTQIFVLQEGGGRTNDTNLLGTWAYREAIAGNDFGKGAAIAIVMVAIALLLTMFYLQQMFRQQEI